MPGIILHTLLSARVLCRLRGVPGLAPFDAADPGAASLFIKGSMAPDMGFYPGGSMWVSDLAHRVRTGDLAREIVASADTEAERAYAWGWVCHVLADTLIHPTINEAAAVAIAPRGLLRGSASDESRMHLRIELGLDCHLFPKNRGVVREAWKDLRSGPSPAFMSSAYRAVYGDTISVADLTASDLALTRFAPLLIRYTSMVASATDAASAALPWLPTNRYAAPQKGDNGSGSVLAPAAPRAPDRKLLTFVLRSLRRFDEVFLHHLRSGVTDLENRNLDSGELEESPHWPWTDPPGALRGQVAA